MDIAVKIDADLVGRLVAAQFPQWGGLPIRPVDFGGWDNRTFRLGDEMSVRLPSAERYADQAHLEHLWLPKLAPHLPLAIPRSLAIGRPGADFPWPWSVRGWLPGSPLSVSSVNDPVSLACSLAGFLNCLHGIEAADGPAAGAHNFHRGGKLAVYDAETEAALEVLGRQVDSAAAREIWSAACSSEWLGDPVWVHGDVAPGNLLLTNGEISAVIDFGCLAVGDPACDLVMAWTYFDGEGQRAFKNSLDLDSGTWVRARGWALWKALIVAAGKDADQRDVDASLRVVDQVVRDHDARA